MGLLDSLSRLSVSTDDIITTANRTIADVGPFTDAVLGHHEITDIIRDAEEGESTLFTHRTVSEAGVKRGVDVRPVPVGVASIMGGASAGVMGVTKALEKELDVDVLLGAALRIVESYGSMPRAKGHIEELHDRAAEVRSRISLLEDELEELKSAEPVVVAEPELPSLKDEERAVVTIEAQLSAARRRRDALREQMQSKKRTRAVHNTGQTISTPTAAARTRTRPGAAAKLANPFFSSKEKERDPDATTNISIHLTSGTAESLVDERPPAWADDSILSHAGGGVQEKEEEEEEVEEGVVPGDSIWEKDDDIGGEEATVVLAIPPPVEKSPPPSPKVAAPVAPPLRARSSAAPLPAKAAPVPEPAPEPASAPASAPVQPPVAPAAPAKSAVEVKPKPVPREPKPAASVKITPEVEANVALIWSTVGKLIAPSSNYGSDSPAPGAAETVSILQSLSAQAISGVPSSPVSASTLQSQSQGTSEPQTILTATLLLHLLRDGPSSLPTVRAALTEKEGEGAAAGLGIKALYACVAKKLLKIDRKGREATVRFE
ncbi:DASH complex subunit spc34 domain-containing protein [Ceratobasidium sp. AG-Ba]|nr:DASH complex subunit spc34 domain-containing protein [Ceratobasidium sp. AG-Ba]QRW04746.1 DASH complex subunit spc34 domain-containing protein [Ceratobasidium sp. AG-Ba]